MKIKNFYGYEIKKSFSKYKINWDKTVSKPQKRIKDIIRPFWEGQDVYEELVIPSSKLRIDLVNFTQNIALEISPRHHKEYNPFFHKNRSAFLASINRDKDKFNWCETNGMKIIELFEEDLKKTDEEILNKILN